MTLEEDGVPVQQMCARRRQLARLLAEDVFTSSVMKMRQLSFSKPLHAATWETTACACSQVAAFRNLLLENRRLSSSRDCVHLAFAGPLRFLLAKAPLHPENESASLFADHQAVVSPFDARSVGESTPRLLACQARSCIRSKKFSKIFLSGLLRCYVRSPNRRPNRDRGSKTPRAALRLRVRIHSEPSARVT